MRSRKRGKDLLRELCAGLKRIGKHALARLYEKNRMILSKQPRILEFSLKCIRAGFGEVKFPSSFGISVSIPRLRDLANWKTQPYDVNAGYLFNEYSYKEGNKFLARNPLIRLLSHLQETGVGGGLFDLAEEIGCEVYHTHQALNRLRFRTGIRFPRKLIKARDIRKVLHQSSYRPHLVDMTCISGAFPPFIPPQFRKMVGDVSRFLIRRRCKVSYLRGKNTFLIAYPSFSSLDRTYIAYPPGEEYGSIEIMRVGHPQPRYSLAFRIAGERKDPEDFLRHAVYRNEEVYERLVSSLNPDLIFVGDIFFPSEIKRTLLGIDLYL